MLHIPECFIPAFIFSKEWLEGPFIIPDDKWERRASYLQLETYSHYGIMWMPGYEKVREILRQRLEVLNPPPKRGIDIPVQALYLSKEWREGNFLFRADTKARAEDMDGIARCVDASILHEPCHRQAQKELRARLAALEAYNRALGIPTIKK